MILKIINFPAAVIFALAVMVSWVDAAPRYPDYTLRSVGDPLIYAYSGVQYEYRLAILGGRFPYTFAKHTGPTGLTVQRDSGIVRWTPSAESNDNQIIIVVTDYLGDTIHHAWQIDVDNSHFSFVDSANGSNSNAGTEAAPYLTISYAGANAGVNQYIYVKQGTYTDNFAGMASGWAKKYIVYPGDSVHWNLNSVQEYEIRIISSNIGFYGFALDGGGDRSWMFGLDGDRQDYFTLYKCNMKNMESLESNNPTFVAGADYSSAANSSIHRYVVVQNCRMDSIYNNSTPGHAGGVVFYDVSHSLVEDCEISNIYGNGLVDKDNGHHNEFRNNYIHDCTNVGIGNASQYNSNDDVILYNRIERCAIGIVLGQQPGYIKNTWIIRNTIKNNIFFAWYCDDATSDSNCVFFNVFDSVSTPPYTYAPAGPGWLTSVSEKMSIDSNVVYCDSSHTAYINADGGGNYGWGAWRVAGFDTHSFYTNPTLESGMNIPTSKTYYNKIGANFIRKASQIQCGVWIR